MQSNCICRVTTLEDKVYLILQCWRRQPRLVYIWHLRLLWYIFWAFRWFFLLFYENTNSNLRYQVKTRLIISHISFTEEFTFYKCLLVNVMNASFQIFSSFQYFSDRGILFTYGSGWLTSGNIYFSALLHSMKMMWSTNATCNQIAWFWNDFLNRLQLHIATLQHSNCRIAWFVTAAFVSFSSSSSTTVH